MKELSVEEKAKRYDNIIEKANKMHSENCEACQACIEELIPEFVETEDERIRKELIDFIYDKTDTYELREKSNSWLAWLEKQGEHANFRNKIQIGDKVTRNKDGVLVNLSQLKRVAKKDEKQGEQKDILEDAILDDNEDGLISETIRCKKEKPCEQKSVWSEEDETNLRRTEYAVMKFFGGDCSLVSWMRKSLRPYSQWKPSEKQMDALRYVTNFDYGGHKATLVSLYEQLKKLK